MIGGGIWRLGIPSFGIFSLAPKILFFISTEIIVGLFPIRENKRRHLDLFIYWSKKLKSFFRERFDNFLQPLHLCLAGNKLARLSLKKLFAYSNICVEGDSPRINKSSGVSLRDFQVYLQILDKDRSV